MLKLIVGETELFNEVDSSFTLVDGITIELEHSLASLSKWESKYQKPFLSTGEKTTEEILEYIKLMIISKDISNDVLDQFSDKNLSDVNEYIESKQSATTFPLMPEEKGRRKETITSELIYYWMVTFNIPFECETWHLNRLFSLIRICNVKQSKPKRMSKGELARRNSELNAQRKARLGTTG